MSAAISTPVQATPEEIVARVFDAMVNTVELFCVYVGDQLGFYQALHDGGPATSPALSARAGTHERYTREWLEQQATAGYLTCENPDADPRERCYALPEAYAPVFVERDSLHFVPPIAQSAAGAVGPVHDLLTAFRT